MDGRGRRSSSRDPPPGRRSPGRRSPVRDVRARRSNSREARYRDDRYDPAGPRHRHLSDYNSTGGGGYGYGNRGNDEYDRYDGYDDKRGDRYVDGHPPSRYPAADHKPSRRANSIDLANPATVPPSVGAAGMAAVTGAPYVAVDTPARPVAATSRFSSTSPSPLAIRDRPAVTATAKAALPLELEDGEEPDE